MSIKIWIDDVRQPPKDENIGEQPWVWVKTSADALEIINASVSISQISFDHDLGGEDTTIPVLKRLEELAYHNQLSRITLSVHSANPVGVKNLLAGIAKIKEYQERNR